MMGYPIPKDTLKREWPIIAKHALSARGDDDLKDVFTFFELDARRPLGMAGIGRPLGVCALWAFQTRPTN